MDMKRQQDSVLYRLGCLKAELSRLSAARKEVVGTSEPLDMANQQQSILGVIRALKEELDCIGKLQKTMDPQVSSVVADVLKSSVIMRILVKYVAYNRVSMTCET